MRRRRAAGLLAAGALSALVPAPASPQGVAPPRLTVTAVANPATTIITGVSFPDSVHGFAVAADNTFLTSADGGRTWAAGRTPLPVLNLASKPEGGTAGFTDVDFTDPLTGHAVALGDKIIATTDGGATWTVQATPRPADLPVAWPGGNVPSGWNFLAVDFVDSSTGYAVGNPGVILATGDGGATWRYQGNPDWDRLTDVAFADTDIGYAVGYVSGPEEHAYLALATVDGGARWSQKRAGSPDDPVVPINFDAVAVTEPRHAVAVGAGGRIFVTFDSGATWRPRRSGTQERLNGVAFADRRRGLVVGAIDFQGELRAQILATNDGGQTWFQRPTPEAANLSRVVFADENTAFVAGCETAIGTCRQGAILRVDFPALEREVEQPLSSGSSPVPLLLVGAAVALVGGAAVVARRR